MKKFKIIIASAFVVAIGIGIFFACDKDLKQVDKNNSKLVQKDNPEQYSVRALYTEDVAIDLVLLKDDSGNVNITYTLSPAQEDDKYMIIVLEPTDEFSLEYNEDSSMVMGICPNGTFYYGWFWGQPFNPSVVTPGFDGDEFEVRASCVSGCTQQHECTLTKTPFPEKKSYCQLPCKNCELTYSAWCRPLYYADYTGSAIIFQANLTEESTITINNSIVNPGELYIIE